jgi:glycosyltransferase involved in cell wall biosynthesis
VIKHLGLEGVPRVLVLAYYFPPLGGAGVQRTVKFLKHLPALGYEATVVTGPEATEIDWAPPDLTLVDEVPPGVAVHRIASPQPVASGGWRRRAERWLNRPTAFQRWWTEGAVQTARLAGAADLVYASMSPFETAAAADRIARERGLPWVADLRDPWALDEWTVYPTGIHRRRDERRMRALLDRADVVVMNTPDAERETRRRFPELSSRLVVIPNGWDEHDFAAPLPERDDAAFRIVYVGYSHDAPGRRHRRLRLLRRALGGSAPGLDVLARSHVFLLEAVERLVAEEPEVAGRIEVHLAGATPPGAHEPSYVRRHGYLPHVEAVALVRSADLLFLPLHDLPPDVRARTVPGKTYEYLAAGRPILAALPDGDARDLLAGQPHVRLCRPTDVGCLQDALRAFLREMPSATTQRETALAYERGRLAKQLASVFDSLVGEPTTATRSA